VNQFKQLFEPAVQTRQLRDQDAVGLEVGADLFEQRVVAGSFLAFGVFRGGDIVVGEDADHLITALGRPGLAFFELNLDVLAEAAPVAREPAVDAPPHSHAHPYRPTVLTIEPGSRIPKARQAMIVMRPE
jgi:hypothetical protein